MTDAPRMLHIDFETGSQADLKKVGVAKYVEDPTTRIICVAYTTPWDENDPDRIEKIWVPPGSKWRPPAGMVHWIMSGRAVAAWNITFEWYVWNHLVDLSFGAPGLSVDLCYDTMAQAAYWGLPLSLDMAGEALPHLGIVKDKAGHALMKRMSRPRSTGPAGVSWWDVDDKARRLALLDYCVTDVRVEKAIHDDLPPLPDKERKIWLMDFDANRRGIPLDTDLVAKMQALAAQEQARLDREMNELTAGAVGTTTQVGALTAWCQAQGLPQVTSLSKDLLPKHIAAADKAGLFKVSHALALRQEAAKSSVAKLKSMTAYACKDGKMRGLTQYYGAFRTGRWAGRGPQVQNFPRSEVKDQEALVHWLLRGIDPQGLMLFFGAQTMTALSSALRGCLFIPKDKGFFAALDFSQIEARALAWLAGAEKVLDAYRSGKDLYVMAAAGIYGVPEAQVTGEQRQIGKVAILALGYQGGVGAFQTMAKNYGLELPAEEADAIKAGWRNSNPEIVSYWWDVQDAALSAVRTPGTVVTVNRGGVRVLFSMWKGHLLVRLPSERHLCYREARLEPGTYGDEVTYMGVDQYTRKWTRISTYGGKFVENITQAVARDVMAEALLRVDDRWASLGVFVLGSVHDEGLLWIHTDNPVHAQARFDLTRRVMETVPEWAKGLPLAAGGYWGRRFRK